MRREAIEELRFKEYSEWSSYEWGEPAYCEPGTYVSGFEIRVSKYYALSDNTGLNGIVLKCRERYEKNKKAEDIENLVNEDGHWKEARYCEKGELAVGADLLVRAPSSTVFSDNTAAENFAIICDSGERIEGKGSYAGTWQGIHRCSKGRALCGFSTQVHQSLGLVTLRLYCCDVLNLE